MFGGNNHMGPMGNMSNMGNMSGGPMMGPGGQMGGPGGQMGGPGGQMGPGGPMGPMHMSGHMGGPKPMPMGAGKMYPPDQPMVFNPQNPNAPPIYPCGMCHKEVNDNDEAVFCESGCNFFFHR